jgi:hypothetical protein
MRCDENGVRAAPLAALLFGLSTPLAKLLLAGVPPVLLAGLLYLGTGRSGAMAKAKQSSESQSVWHNSVDGIESTGAGHRAEVAGIAMNVVSRAGSTAERQAPSKPGALPPARRQERRSSPAFGPKRSRPNVEGARSEARTGEP